MSPAVTKLVIELALAHGEEIIKVAQWVINGCLEADKPDVVAKLHPEQLSELALEKKLGREL